MAAYNYAGAFVEFCNGTPVEEIAMVLNIPEDRLKAKIRDERWTILREQLPARIEPVAMGLEKAKAQAELMQKNREENYALWMKLRSDAAKVIGELCDGTLRFKRYWHNKGMVTEKVVEPTMNDRTALANYLQMIAMGSYAALGDRGATSGAKDGGDAVVNASQAPAITIVLPGVISAPREERAEVQISSRVSAVIPRQTVDAEVISETPHEST